LIQQYKTDPPRTQLERAEAEADIWIAVRRIYGKGCVKTLGLNRRDWFTETIGGEAGKYEDRSILLNTGELATPLWERVEDGRLKMSMAVALLRKAKEFSKKQDMPLNKALDQILLGQEGVATGELNSDSIPPFNGSLRKNTQVFYRYVEAGTKRYVEAQAGDLLTADATRLTKDFVDSVFICCDVLREEIRKKKQQHKSETTIRVGKVRFNQACEVLALSWGFGIVLSKAQLDDAKRRMNQRMRSLHPDLTKIDTEEVRKEMTSVRESYDILVQYSKERK